MKERNLLLLSLISLTRPFFLSHLSFLACRQTDDITKYIKRIERKELGNNDIHNLGDKALHLSYVYKLLLR